MAYIGSTPTSQNFISGTDYFNGTGSQTAFTLTRTVNSVNDVEVVVNNVIQQPNSYTISGTTLTLSAAPSSGTSNVYVRYLATNQQSFTVGNNTVGYNQLTADAQQGLGNSFKNRLINGCMRIDQRNSGASVTLDGSESFITDRWACGDVTDGAFTGQQVTDAPVGFINSLKCTITTADTSLAATQVAYVKQAIEGLNCTDLGWGTANAKTVTLSFWVKSSLTGTFGGALRNSGASRSYPFSYTISSASTWEQKTVTITGDTTGTWLTTNGIGIDVQFSLGAGSSRTGIAGAWNANNNVGATGQVQVISTNGATWQMTGVQLEVGTQATTFDCRAYGTELALCQRYFFAINAVQYARYPAFGGSSTGMLWYPTFPVQMRTTPTMSNNVSTSDFEIYNYTGANAPAPTSINLNEGDAVHQQINIGASGGGLSSGAVASWRWTTASTAKYFGFSAEL